MSTKEPENDDFYTDTPTHVRIWTDGVEWYVDAADDGGKFTVACFSYDSFDAALADMKFFIECVSDSGVTFLWNKDRPKGMYWRRQAEQSKS